MWWPFIHKTPCRRQIDPIECGAVVLGIILESFGRFVTNAELRKRANTSRSGSDASSLIKAALHFGLHGKAQRITTEDLKKIISPPAILFVDGGHFVVFEGYFLGRFFLNDPARGRYSLTPSEMRKRFCNIAIQFSLDQKMTDGHVFSQQQFFPIPTDSLPKLFSKLSMLLLGLCAGFFVVMMASIIGFLLSAGEDESRSLLIMGGGGVILFALVIITFVFAWRAIENQALRSCRKEIEHLVVGLHRVPYSFFDDVPFYIFARIFADSIYRSILHAHGIFIYFIFSAALVQLLSSALIYWPVALLWLGCFAIFIGQSMLKRSDQHQIFSDQWALNDALDHAVDMRFMGQEKNLMDGLIKKEFAGFINQDLILSPAKAIISSPIIPFAIFLCLFCLITRNAWTSGALSVEELLSLLILSFTQAAAVNLLLEKPKSSWTDASSLFYELAEASKKNIEEINDPSTNTLIKLEKLSFLYRGAQKKLFEEIDLAIERGSIIAVVGAPLLGTTTLMHLIAGKIAPTVGRVIHFVQSYPLRSAIIDDDSEPFLGTLKDNITLFSHHINEQKMVWALEQACATDLFYNRPLGLLAPILASGKNLSVQERKRLLLAQALAHRPDFLVLDGFFEFLDDDCARKILENLRALKITTVFSSYRESDLEKTDHIVWIKSPHSLVKSRHEELLIHDPVYRRLVVQVIEDQSL